MDGKIQKRLKIMSVKRLRLNVARIVIQSKINSIPRYLSGLNVITKKSCERVEENISGTGKKLMGFLSIKSSYVWR